MSSGSYRPPWIAKRAAEASSNNNGNSSSGVSNGSTSPVSKQVVPKAQLLRLRKPWNQNENQVYASSASFVETVTQWYTAAWTTTPDKDLIHTDKVASNGQRVVRLTCKHHETLGASNRCEMFFSARQIRNSDGRFELSTVSVPSIATFHVSDIAQFNSRHSETCPIRLPINTSSTKPPLPTTSSPNTSTTPSATLKPCQSGPSSATSQTIPPGLTSGASQSVSFAQSSTNSKTNINADLKKSEIPDSASDTASLQVAVAKAKELATINPPPTKLSIAKAIVPLFNTTAATRPAKSPTPTPTTASSSAAARAEPNTPSIPSVHTFNHSSAASVKTTQQTPAASSTPITTASVASTSSTASTATTHAPAVTVKKTFTAISPPTNTITLAHEREISAGEAERLALGASERAEIGHIAISLPMRKSVSRESLGSQSKSDVKTKASPVEAKSPLPSLPNTTATLAPPSSESSLSSVNPSNSASAIPEQNTKSPIPTGPRTLTEDPRLAARAGWKMLNAEERARAPGPVTSPEARMSTTAGPDTASTGSISRDSGLNDSNNNSGGMTIKGLSSPQASNSQRKAQPDRTISNISSQRDAQLPQLPQLPIPRSQRGRVHNGKEAETARSMRRVAAEDLQKGVITQARYESILATADSMQRRAPAPAPTSNRTADPRRRPTVSPPNGQITTTPIADKQAVTGNTIISMAVPAPSKPTEPLRGHAIPPPQAPVPNAAQPSVTLQASEVARQSPSNPHVMKQAERTITSPTTENKPDQSPRVPQLPKGAEQVPAVAQTTSLIERPPTLSPSTNKPQQTAAERQPKREPEKPFNTSLTERKDPLPERHAAPPSDMLSVNPNENPSFVHFQNPLPAQMTAIPSAAGVPHTSELSTPVLPASESPSAQPPLRQSSAPTSSRKAANLTVQTKRSVSSRVAPRNSLGIDSFDLLASFEESAPTSAITSNSSVPSAVNATLFSATLPPALDSAITNATSAGLASAVPSTASRQSPRSPSGSSQTSLPAEECQSSALPHNDKKKRIPAVMSRKRSPSPIPATVEPKLSNVGLTKKEAKERQPVGLTAGAKLAMPLMEPQLPWTKPLPMPDPKIANSKHRKAKPNKLDPRLVNSVITMNAGTSTASPHTSTANGASSLQPVADTTLQVEESLAHQPVIAPGSSSEESKTEGPVDKPAHNKRKVNDARDAVRSVSSKPTDSSEVSSAQTVVSHAFGEQTPADGPRKKARLEMDEEGESAIRPIVSMVKAKKKTIVMSDSDEAGGDSSSSEAEIPIARLAALKSRTNSPSNPSSAATTDTEEKKNADGKRTKQRVQTSQEATKKKRKLTDSVDETVLRALAHEEKERADRAERAEREELERLKAERRQAKSARNAERRRKKEEKAAAKTKAAKEEEERKEAEAQTKERERLEEEKLLKEKREAKERKQALKEERRKKKEARRKARDETAKASLQDNLEANEQVSTVQNGSRECSTTTSARQSSQANAKQDDGDKMLVGVASSSPNKPHENTDNVPVKPESASPVAGPPPPPSIERPTADSIILSDHFLSQKYVRLLENLGYKTLGDLNRARVGTTYEARCELLEMLAQMDLHTVEPGAKIDPIRTWAAKRLFQARIAKTGAFQFPSLTKTKKND